jgi:YHS domain-containing protein
MRSLRNSLTALAVILGLAIAVNAGDAATQKSAEAPKELRHQTICPVMGGKIDSAYYTDIQGQRIYHCCAMCAAKLKADPDKYFKEAAAQGILFENIQTDCPVCGMELKDKLITTDYEGRHLAFCSDDCRTNFQKDPAKYLKKMDAESQTQEKKSGDTKDMKSMKDMKGMDHSDQSH